MDHWLAFGLLCIVLVIAAITDWRTGSVFNWLTFPAIGAGILFALVTGLVTGGLAGMGHGLANALVGLAAGYIPFLLIFLMGGVGGGDTKLMAAVGAISASWKCVVSTMFYGFMIGAVFAVIVMVRKRIVRQTLQRLFITTLSAAARVKPALPTDSPRIPLSVAFCLGGILAGMEYLLAVPMPWPGL